MDESTQRQWAELAVRTINEVFPSERWLPIQALLPHALVCARLIDDYQFSFPEASHLLDRAASYLQDAARYQEAELLFLRSLAINEKVLGPEHSGTSATLHNLALLYQDQGRYQEAEPLFLRSLAINEKVLGPEHPNTATTLENYANLLQKMNRQDEVAPLRVRARAIRAKRQP